MRDRKFTAAVAALAVSAGLLAAPAPAGAAVSRADLALR